MADNSSAVAGLSRFVRGDARGRRLRLDLRGGSTALEQLFEGAFETLPVDVAVETDDPEVEAERVSADPLTEPGDPVAGATVELIEGDEVVERSPLEELMDAFLLVNSDWYKTRSNQLESLTVPAVLSALADTVFRLQGYPASHREKLLLVVLSRYVEQVAYRDEGGTLRTGFQQLSRVEDEWGTNDVYRTLAGGDVDVHAYGVPDARPDLDAMTVHAGRSPDYRDTWFVVYRPDGPRRRHAALIAHRPDDAWRGVWTFDPGRVRDVESYIDAEL